MPTDPAIEFVDIDGERALCIRDVDKLDPFLMSIVSDSDHWLFVGSNGPFTAGRVDADRAVFPYQTVDKILRHADSGGAMTILQVRRGDAWVEWSPTQRNLSKHIHGCSVVFEEADADLKLQWSLTACEPYGFVRQVTLTNLSGSPLEVRYLDGWHQILPPKISKETFGEMSYLAAAYMRHEAHPNSLAIFTLNAGISDRAEAAESLRAACAWSIGHANPVILLSERQVKAFRQGRAVEPETEVRGEMGAYLVAGSTVIDREVSWMTVIDTWMDHASIVQLKNELEAPTTLKNAVAEAVARGRAGLRNRIAAADGLQDTGDAVASVHHFANVLFNCMRGGTFPDGYRFPSLDFGEFVRARNRSVYDAHHSWIKSLDPTLTLSDLHRLAETQGDPQLARLSREYLPLTFSRRHGDPSRPWNRFNIHLKNEHGDPVYAYQGNWRDIFQNWESLGQSYPRSLEPMVATFLNATTADGYNPYRIMREGIEWEVPDPDNPWSNIGYWGDHQIVYLLRLLESWEKFEPGAISKRLHAPQYTFACIPYEIGDFDSLARDPHNSITFNWQLHKELMAREESFGGDGKLLQDQDGSIRLATLAEKLLVPALVKLSNLVPGGGIWLNTQRPEWNDANNALAGWGLSMVTVCYLRRYLAFLATTIGDAEVHVSSPLAKLLNEISTILKTAAGSLDDAARYKLMEKLGRAGAEHRKAVYQGRLGETEKVSVAALVQAALPVLDSTIREARRTDGLYESYSMLHLAGGKAGVQTLSLMLEGQVAVLSSGVLSAEESVQLLRALRQSDLYREDQHSYILYPDRKLTPFMERNTLAEPPAWVDRSVFTQDPSGSWHFQADLRNAGDLAQRLDELAVGEGIRKQVLELWEQTFNHKKFTGRSGTMFMFEGLGSIYWHMIAKLLLAIQECWQKFGDERLAEAYHDIRNGLGFRKSPEEYGAFPTDPYSHTPKHRGAQQPGMTGQVKEEILTRWGELGVKVEEGRLVFEPRLLPKSEFHTSPHRFDYVDVDGREQSWEMPAGSLGFTFCQVPICYILSESSGIRVEQADGSVVNTLESDVCDGILDRSGNSTRITVHVTLK